MKILIKFISILFFTTSCGFKVANLDNNFKLIEINTTGENKISYLLKNGLMTYSSNQSSYLITINANTELKKLVKEKNINNQITKYQIQIETNIDYKNIDRKLSNNFTIQKIGNYNVDTKFTNTKENERKLITRLVDEMIEDISRRISLNLNDY